MTEKMLTGTLDFVKHLSVEVMLLSSMPSMRGGGGGAGPFSVSCDWPFLKSVICEKTKFNSVICDRGIFCDV